MYRYYSTQRPFGPGTFPKQEGYEAVTNFFAGKIYCKEIGAEAWGFIEYPSPLSKEEIKNYELTPAKTTGCVTGCVLEGVDERGRTVAFLAEGR